MTKLSLVNTHRKGPDSLFVFYSKFLQNTCYSNNYKTLNIPIIQIMKSNEFFPKENSVIFFQASIAQNSHLKGRFTISFEVQVF